MDKYSLASLAAGFVLLVFAFGVWDWRAGCGVAGALLLTFGWPDKSEPS